MLPEYTFIPWLRRGVAAEISAPDRLGANPETGPVGRATLPVELTLDRVQLGGGTGGALPSVQREVAILSPGDVAAVKREAILRTQPADGALGVTPGELAYVEFYEEDFPWRYTPARPTASRLRPWLALLVLEPDEFELRERQGALPALTLAAGAPLPERTETWAWAHAQVSRRLGAPSEVDAAVDAAPDLALSRLLCPRRLLAGTQYHAFLVPAFEAGRLAGLGRDAGQVPVQKPAWGTTSFEADPTLPVYHRFSFATGETGDFETLARKLVAGPVGQEFGKRPLDVSAPGFGLPAQDDAEVGLEAALAPPALERKAFPTDPYDEVADRLAEILDAGELREAGEPDLLVVPPIYGRWHAGVPLVASAKQAERLAWLAELNLDVRNRAAAGLGAEVVRERQEEYMQRAWEQIGRVEEANQRLREAELARSAATSVYAKHVAAAGKVDRALVLTAAVQTGLTVPAAGDATSIRAAVDASRVPAAAQAPAFRRVTRPQRPLMRRLPGRTDAVAFQDGLLTEMDKPAEDALTTAPPPPDPEAGVALQTVRGAVRTSLDELRAKPGSVERLFIEQTHEELRVFLDPSLPGGPGNIGGLDRLQFIGRVQARIDARHPAGTSTQEERDRVKRAKDLAGAIAGIASDPPSVVVTVEKVPFEAELGLKVRGKAFGALQVVNQAPPAADLPLSRMTSENDVQQFQSALGTFDNVIVSGRKDPRPPGGLGDGPSALASHVLGVLRPALTIGDRVASALPAIAGRLASDPARLAPVMAYPTFPDPLFEPLRALSQDHIIPNVSDLPRDSLTLMEPNARFIEAFLAGVNHAFAQELLWREYPTDQRASSFRVFWDRRDAIDATVREDVKALDAWDGELGRQSTAPDGVLVLVVRGELLERYPTTVIFAQQALQPPGGGPRALDPAGEVHHPLFHARLEPDVTIVGFGLPEARARGGAGDPGFFFVLMERPGEPRFGLDETTPPGGLSTWNDLAWDALGFPGGTPYVGIDANAALAPATPAAAAWGRTSADMASILFQSPILFARHASEMLP